MASKIALTLLAVGGFLSLGMTNAQASIFLGASSESNDINAINDVVPGAGFTGENLLGKIDTDELSPDEGSLIDFFSVHGGTDPDPVNWGDSPGGVEFADEDLYVQFWFENLPVMLEEPFYITIKYATTTDVYEWSTDNGDVKGTKSRWYMGLSQYGLHGRRKIHFARRRIRQACSRTHVPHDFSSRVTWRFSCFATSYSLTRRAIL